MKKFILLIKGLYAAIRRAFLPTFISLVVCGYFLWPESKKECLLNAAQASQGQGMIYVDLMKYCHEDHWAKKIIFNLLGIESENQPKQQQSPYLINTDDESSKKRN